MNFRSSDLADSSNTAETVSRLLACTEPRFITSSATQTTDEESRPPLKSAQTGPSTRRRVRTASENRSTKCSSYSRSVWYRISLLGSSPQNLLHETFPLRRIAKCAGGTAWIFLYGVSPSPGCSER